MLSVIRREVKQWFSKGVVVLIPWCFIIIEWLHIPINTFSCVCSCIEEFKPVKKPMEFFTKLPLRLTDWI